MPAKKASPPPTKKPALAAKKPLQAGKKSAPKGRWRALFWRCVRWTLLLLLLAVAGLVAAAWTAMGQRATGARRARMEASPQWKNGAFENPQPLRNDVLGSITAILHASDHASPREPVPHQKIDPQTLRTLPKDGLRVTWLGHSTTLIEIDGQRVLTDPVWSDKPSPIAWLGPQRYYPPPVALKDLPPIDAVVISHDHYDHLDYPTMAAMKGWKKTRFFVPLGVGAHLEYWGIPPSQLEEMDWWQTATLGKLTVACTPARHASGRMGFDKDGTLWAGWALVGPEHRLFFSGDTGLFPAMRDIGSKFGPFDLAMVEVGQYHQAWPDWHIGPEQAVKAGQWLRGQAFLPIHWALFTLAMHGWTEPGERALAEALKMDAPIWLPLPGQSFEPVKAPPEPHKWWPSVPWKTAADDPIVSTQVPP